MAEALRGIDTHERVVDADPWVVWTSISEVLGSEAGWLTRLGARALGCRHVRESGPRPLTVGSTMCGFRVSRADAPRELALEGAHRFSEYALILRISEDESRRTRLAAETRAIFPGRGGRLYRAAVIGSRVHAVAMARLLRAIKGRAERLARTESLDARTEK